MKLSEILQQYFEFEHKVQNVHQEHLPDEVFNLGQSGIDRAVEILEAIVNKQSDKVEIKLKWDGAPAVVFGELPSDLGNYKKGTFFIGTKGVFAKDPVLAISKEEISRVFMKSGAGLVQKLTDIFDQLKSINPKGVFQGDLMWSRNTDKEKVTIDGKRCIVFQPNTIVYGVAQSDDPDLYRIIDNSMMGIVIHTKYNGDDLSSMKPSYNVVMGRDYINDTDIWFGNPTVEIGGVLSDEDTIKIKTIIDKIKGTKIDPKLFDALQSVQPPHLIKTFINELLKKENVVIGDVEGFVGKLVSWYTQRIEKEKGELKKEIAKQRRDDLLSGTLRNINKYKNALLKLLTVYKLIDSAKDIVVNAFDVSVGSKVHTWLKEGDAFNTTSHEGYVAVMKRDNSINKLVNRLKFSRANLTAGRFK